MLDTNIALIYNYEDGDNMSLEKIVQKSELLDEYGLLLTKRQRECLDLYYNENLTLAEIAENFRISRQAVHDAMRHGEEQLNIYEKTLGVITKRKSRQNAVNELKNILSEKSNRVETLLDFLSE